VKISPSCHLIAVVGGKGGVGKSVFAANFAAAIMMELRTQVLLIDADERTAGDQNVILGLRPQKTIAEIAMYQGALNQQTLPQIVTTHPSGLGYIGAVRGPDETLKANAEAFIKQLEFLSRTYKYIVVDLGSDLGSLQMALLQEATAAMIVTTPEVLVINQTQRLINELLTATFPMDMFQLVVNKSSPTGLSIQAITQTLRLNPIGTIPLDEVVTAGSLQRSSPFVISQNQAPISRSYHDIVRKLTGGVLQRLKSLNKPTQPTVTATSPTITSPVSSGVSDAVEARNALKIRIHNELIKAMDLKKGIADTQGDDNKEKALKQKTQQMITQIVDRELGGVSREERSKIIKEVLEEALGLGPLEDLLADPNIKEIMVNGYRKIYVEKSGVGVYLTPVTFTSNLHLKNVIERIVMPLGRRIDEKTPYVDARLKDGSRVHAIIEPLSIDGPALTIRKFTKGGITSDMYLSYNSLTKPMIDFLRVCVQNGLNIVISGGTGTGKTSLLNMLSSFIPPKERIVTVEDAAELQVQQEHVVRLETRPANMEGSGSVSIRDLIRNALRMRPDRIVVGECRDGAALDMLQAMNTGHDGSMTTVHANTPRECLSRIETLCLMAGMDLPMRAIREQVASAVDLIVQIQRLPDNTRKIVSISEVTGLQGEAITLSELFRFKETGFDKNSKIIGTFQATGIMPSFIDELEQKGVKIPRDMFSNDPKSQNAPSSQSIQNPPPPIKRTGTGGRS
jgi:pilus assembly protein CpaF